MSVSSVLGNAVQAGKGNAARLQQFFQDHPDVNFLRFEWMDFAASVKVYILTKTAAIEAAEKGFMLAGVSSTVSIAASAGMIREHLECHSDELIPDWSSLKTCMSYPSHASVMCFVRQPQPNKPKNGYDIDPRSLLMHQTNSAAHDQIDILIGLEIEFFISDAATDFAKTPPRTSVLGLNAMRNKFNPTVDEIVLAIEKAGIKVNKYHPEDGVLGMYEIVLAPLPPLQAADSMVYCHDLIKSMCQQKGFAATVSPCPFERDISIGSHINISISPPDSGHSDSFLAGLLEHLLAICAFSTPNYNSYERLQRLRPWVFWGDGSKPCPIHQRRKGLWEIRIADATMNPYIAFAAIIAAGMHGLRSKQELTIKGETTYAADLTDEIRKERNITRKLPLSLEEALTALEADQFIGEDENGLGERFVKTYCVVKRKDIEYYKTLSELEKRLHTMISF